MRATIFHLFIERTRAQLFYFFRFLTLSRFSCFSLAFILNRTEAIEKKLATNTEKTIRNQLPLVLMCVYEFFRSHFNGKTQHEPVANEQQNACLVNFCIKSKSLSHTHNRHTQAASEFYTEARCVCVTLKKLMRAY